MGLCGLRVGAWLESSPERGRGGCGQCSKTLREAWSLCWGIFPTASLHHHVQRHWALVGPRSRCGCNRNGHIIPLGSVLASPPWTVTVPSLSKPGPVLASRSTDQHTEAQSHEGPGAQSPSKEAVGSASRTHLLCPAFTSVVWMRLQRGSHYWKPCGVIVCLYGLHTEGKGHRTGCRMVDRRQG